MPSVPQIFVAVDVGSKSYTFTTDGSGDVLAVDYLGTFTIVATGDDTDIQVVATLPATATHTVPFEPAMTKVTVDAATYQLTAIGMVTLTVPSYQGVQLTGTPLVLAPHTGLLLSESGDHHTPLISFGATVTLSTDLKDPTTAYVASGLFVGEAGHVTVAPGVGSTYTIGDVDELAYPVSTENSSKLIPLIGTINVGSTKKPKL